MNKPEQQLEAARRDYVSKRYPGSLADVLDDGKVERVSRGSVQKRRFRIGWLVAAILLIGVTVASLLLVDFGDRSAVLEPEQNLNGTSIAKKKMRFPTSGFSSTNTIQLAFNYSSRKEVRTSTYVPALKLVQLSEMKRKQPGIWKLSSPAINRALNSRIGRVAEDSRQKVRAKANGILKKLSKANSIFKLSNLGSRIRANRRFNIRRFQ